MDLFRRFSPRDRRSDGPPQSVSPRNTHNPSVQVPSPTPWLPPSGPTHRPDPTYSVQGSHSRQGNAPHSHWAGHSHNDNSHSGDFTQPGNFTSPSGNQPIAQTNSFSSHSPQDSPTNEARNWFVAIDQDGNEELSYEELRSALLTNGNRQFSSVTVKYLVSIFDLNGDGVIGFEEFEPLWSYLNQWIRMFDSFDQDRNGIIDTAELGHALANYGIQLAPDVIDIVMKKYGEAPAAPSWNRQLVPAPLMELDHFVCACVSVREMCRVYEDCSAEGRPRMDRDAFLRAVLVLP